jgi:hypothetical protein
MMALGYMVRPLLYTTMKMLLMPLCLQVCTACLMLSRLSSAVLAVVVSQTPRMALGFHTGPEGLVFPPPLLGGVLLFLLQELSEQAATKSGINSNRRLEWNVLFMNAGIEVLNGIKNVLLCVALGSCSNQEAGLAACFLSVDDSAYCHPGFCVILGFTSISNWGIGQSL